MKTTKTYKLVMEGVEEKDDIIIENNLTLEEAEKLLSEYKNKDWIHYYTIKEEK